MTHVMARMKLLFSLPFCFLVCVAALGQEVKKVASGEEHSDTLNYNIPSVISIDSIKLDTVAKEVKIENTTIDTVAKSTLAKKDSLLTPKYNYPVPYFLEIGISGNSYRGDISNSYKSFSPSLNMGIQLNRRRWLNGYFGISVGQVNGLTPNLGYTSPTDPNLTANTYFNTIFFQAKYELNINIIKKDWITAYVGIGIGFMNFTPYDQEGISLVGQTNSRAKGETYTNNSAIFPLSAGVRVSLKNYWAIHLQASLLNQTTAYIDNIKTLSNNSVGDNIFALKLAVLAPLKINR